MSALGDVYQVLLEGSYGANTWSNVFWYKNTQYFGAGGADVLGQLFVANVLDKLCELQHTTTLYSRVQVIDYGDPSEFAEDATPAIPAGLLTGDTSPAFVAFSYRLQRQQPGQRHGYKRFIGAPDADVVGNTWAPNATNQAALATALALELDDGVDWRFAPCVVKHSDVIFPDYEITLGLNPNVKYIVTAATPLSVIRTQVSRRRANVN